MNHPLAGLASKMPLYVSLQENCTNIPEGTDYGNAMFLELQGGIAFFSEETRKASSWLVERPVAQALCHNGERRRRGKNHHGRSEPPETIKRQKI